MVADVVKTKPSSEIICENIHKLLRKKNLSDAAFASQISVTRQTVWRWRTGKDEPMGKCRDRVAASLGVSVPSLFRG